MQLLKNSFLAISCAVSVILLAISTVLPGAVSNVAILTSLILALGLAIVATVRNFRKIEKQKITRLVTYFAVTFLMIAVILSSAYDFFHNDIKYAQTHKNKNIIAVGTVTDVRWSQSYSSSVSAEITEIDGNKTKLNAIIEMEAASPIRKTDIFILEGTVSDFDDNEAYLISDGFSMKITVNDVSSVIVTGSGNKPWYDGFEKIADEIQYYFDIKTSEQTSGLVGAMLLGDKSGLDSSTERDFRRIGISHMLALSGLHISIIIGGLDLILIFMGLERSKRSIALILSSILYLFITGFSLSASRAVIMVCIVYLAYLFSDEADRVTSLFISAYVIFTIFPSALYDIGFWMSFLATLSIIIVSNLLGPLTFKLKKKPLIVQIAVKLLSAVSVTFAATISVSVFSWLVFKEVSIISILSNLLFSIPAILVIALSAIAVLLGFVPYLSSVIFALLDLVVDCFLKGAAWLSDWRGITVSMKYDFVKFIIPPMLIVTLIFVLIYLRRKWLVAVPAGVAILAFAVCLVAHNAMNSGISTVSYMKNGSSEMMTVVNVEAATVCDMSSGGFSHFKRAYDDITERNATEIENLILTHYHQYHPNTVRRICETYTVRNVYIPCPQNERDIKWYEAVSSALEKLSAKLVVYYPEAEINVGNGCSLVVSEHRYIDRSVHPVYCVTVTNNGESLSYFSSSVYENEDFDDVKDANHLIFGVHGPNIHNEPPYSEYDLSGIESLVLADRDEQWSSEMPNSIDYIAAEDDAVYSFILDGK